MEHYGKTATIDVAGKVSKTPIKSGDFIREDELEDYHGKNAASAEDVAAAVNTLSETNPELFGGMTEAQVEAKIESANTVLENNIIENVNSRGFVARSNDYVEDANDHVTTGYVKCGKDITTNLPDEVIGTVSQWGMLLYIAENIDELSGTQIFYPVDGEYKGRVFTRSLVHMNPEAYDEPIIGDWTLLAVKTDVDEWIEDYISRNNIGNGGGTVSDADIATAVSAYMAEHPVEGGSGTSIDDTTTTATDKTWSASKIKSEIDSATVADGHIEDVIESYLTENPQKSLSETDQAKLNKIDISGSEDLFLNQTGSYSKTVKYSRYEPSETGVVGDIVYREKQVPFLNVGWVYTAKGWMPFGQVSYDNSAVYTSADATESNKVKEWTHILSPTSSEDFSEAFYWEVDGQKKIKNTLSSFIKKISEVNGYKEEILPSGMLPSTKVFVLGNTPTQDGQTPTRDKKIGWNLIATDSTLQKEDFKIILEMDVALLTPTKNSNRVASWSDFDMGELCFIDSTSSFEAYVGFADDRWNGRIKTCGDTTKNGEIHYDDNEYGLRRYLGYLPLDTFVTLRFEVNSKNNIALYMNNYLIEENISDLYVQSQMEETIDGGDKTCGFYLYFGDSDNFVCKEIRAMNLNSSKLKDND